MKIPFKLVLILLSIFFVYSCETDEIIDQTTHSETFERKGDGSVKNNEPEPVNLQNRMQWISYMTAQVLLRDFDAREQFKDVLENSATPNVIALSDLLNVIDTSFKDEFKVEFLYHYFNEEVNNPCGDIGRPNSRPRPPGVTGGVVEGTPIEDYLFDLYVASILNDDCLELYLPNAFSYLHITGSTDGPDSIKSSAHPLTEASTNYGFNHTSECYVFTTIVGGNEFGITIITRPIRDYGDCAYDKYSVNDFEDFMD